MAFKPVDEHAAEDRATGAKPKYLRLKNGVLVPYNKDMARHKNNGAGVKEGVLSDAAIPLHAMPADYAASLKAMIDKRESDERSRTAYLAQAAAEMDEVRQRTLSNLKADQANIKVGKAEKQAQNQLNAQIEPAEFVISTASAKDLVEFAKTNLRVDLDPTVDVELLRKEVARLTGVEAS